MKDIPLNEYKNISIKDDFDELCKMFGKVFPMDENENEEDKKKLDCKQEVAEEIEKKNEEELIDLRFDQYVKIKEYKESFDIVNYNLINLLRN